MPGPSRLISHAATLTALAGVPLLVIVFTITFHELLEYFSDDPDYAYLFNGLNLIQFHRSEFTEHPGTTLQIFSGFIIGSVWLFRAPFQGLPTLQDDVLLHPELYLYAINLAMAIIGAGAIFFLGWRIRAYSRSIAAGMVAQVSMFVSVPVLTLGIARVAPEVFLIVLTVLLAAVLVPAVFSPSSPQTFRFGAQVGTIIGACLATKMTAAPLVLTVLYLRDRKAQIAAILGVLIFGVVFTLPAASHYRRMMKSFFAYATHIGPNGTGPVGSLPLAELWANLSTLFGVAPEMFVTVALCGLLSLRYAVIAQLDKTRLFMIAALVVCVQLAMVAMQPRAHYLVPAVAIMSLANGGIAAIVMTERSWRRGIGALLGAVLLALGLRHAAGETSRWLAVERAQRQDNLGFARAAAAAHPGCVHVYYYDAPTIEYKLLFGDGWAGGRYSQRLTELYPNYVAYGVLNPIDGDQWLAEKKCVYFIGSPLERFEHNDFGLGISPDYLEMVSRTGRGLGGIALYELRRPPNGGSVFTVRRQ